MMKVGLTGWIAVGKSFVLGVLAELGCRVLNADVTAREVVAPESPGLRAAADAFGTEVLLPDGGLDRARLGSLIFADEQKRLRLNSILHPFIIAKQDEQMRKWEGEDPKVIAVIDAALMIESGGYRRFAKVIVLHCPRDLQLQRLMSRDCLARAQAEPIISAPIPPEEK